MEKGDSITNHLNVFNTIINQLLSVDFTLIEEKFFGLLCSLLNPWDILVMATRSYNTTLKINNVVGSVLSEEMRKNEHGRIDKQFPLGTQLIGRKRKRKNIQSKIQIKW